MIRVIILNNTNISFHELDTITEMQIIMDSTQVGADSIRTHKQNRTLAIENRILEIIIQKAMFRTTFN